MGLAIIHSRASVGVQAPSVSVEVHISNGMPGFTLVGLPETTVKESKDRVRSAIINSNFQFPAKRITVNLAPADLPKEGGRFDLPIALGILAASEQIATDKLKNYEFVGELALSGGLRPVKGVLPAALEASKIQRHLVVPHVNGDQAALVGKEQHKSAQSLLEVCAELCGQHRLNLFQTPKRKIVEKHGRDLQDIIGQQQGKRALEIAAAGNHNWKSRPFRSPHHSSSMAALVGGGSVPRPGEISLAHNGLLFLDEMPEFDRKVLDSLREPLESGEIIISRAQGKTRFPARFQLVGALNPSPTGYYEGNQARTNPQAILRYLGRLSGPLLDRFDMSLEIPALPKGTLAEGGDRGEPTAIVKERVNHARTNMLNRSGKVNTLLGSREIEAFCPLHKSDAEFLETALHRLGLSIRAYHRIIKVARTIADLDGAEQIERAHLAEALGYRAMDRLLKQLTAQAV
ncbi:TPA: YifB family Mg chelatase-like AAA ATPase [Vibrio diabolicus]